MAKSVEAKIKEEGKPPHMVDYLFKENLKNTGITYLQGNLGLFNHYVFDPKNIFGLKEGVIGSYGDFEIFIFKYEDEEECLKWFQEARSQLSDHPEFRDYTKHRDGFSLIDAQGKYVFVKSFRNIILIYLGLKESFKRTLFDQIQSKISNDSATH